MTTHAHWQAINDSTLVYWESNSTSDGPIKHTPTQLFMRGTLTWHKLQGVGLSRLTHSCPGFPEWHQVDPPSWPEVEARWCEGADARDRACVSVTIDEFSNCRSSSESTADFYTRVADFYTHALSETGRPTKTLASVADVPYTTAARWVRVARERGLLTATTKGRSLA